MNIRPIMNDEDHAAALDEIERLWGAKPGTEESDRLDVLATLAEHYEERRFPLPDADPVTTIKVHMEMTGRTQSDLSALLGSASRASELLNRKRVLTMEMVHRLNKEWNIPADALIRPYDLDRSKRRST